MAPNSTSNGLTKHRAVAPTRHTIILLLVLFGFSFSSAHAGSLTPLGQNTGRAFGCVLVMIFEWGNVAFIWFGIRRRGVRISDLVGDT